MKWPGLAAVIVSVLHIQKGQYTGTRLLEGRTVPEITAFLFHAGGHDNPAALKANASKSFIGSYVLGMGFTFDDTNPEATPIAEMHRLIEKDLRNQERIFPYIGGEEVNSSPTHAHDRYVINFGEMSETEARQWPELIKILEEKVKPQRDQIIARGKQIHEYDYWKFWDKRTETYEAIAPLDRVLVCCIVSKYLSFTFMPTNMVYSHRLTVFTLESYAAFATLQSSIYEVFARFFSSTMKDDINYSPSDCFEPFPFPKDWETNPTLEAAGKTYYEFRADLMVRNNEGLTDTYNRFHDPDEINPEILKLRELHAAMDRAVLDAYGWTDLQPHCEFLLDYEEEDPLTLDLSPTKGEGRQKKKPYRYRWPEEIHDEVLARLLALNTQRAEKEQLAGSSRIQPQRSPRKSKARPSKTLALLT